MRCLTVNSPFQILKVSSCSINPRDWEFSFLNLHHGGRETSRLRGCQFHEEHDPLHGVECELAFRKSQDRPVSQCRLEVFFNVGQESLRPSVPAMNPNSTFDFDQSAARDVSEVGTPTATGVKDKFLLKGRAVRRPPEEREPGFQAGRGSFVAESESSHP